MKKMKKQLGVILLALVISMGGVATVYAQSFGNSLNGASTVEVLQVKYNGAAWNYPGSGYKNASFKYVRAGRTLLSKTATNGKVTGSVWDNLLDWSEKQTTLFYWNHEK